MNSSLGYKISESKFLTEKILHKNKIPATSSFRIKTLLDLEKINIGKGKSYVIKPINWKHGNWVHTNVTTQEEIVDITKKLLLTYTSVLIQKQVRWDEMRVLVCWWKVLYCMVRHPAHVVWDWKLTIQKLIDKENKNPLRWVWYKKPLSNIIIDDILLWYIQKKWLSLSHIPEKDTYTQLRGNSNLWTGGTIENMTDQTHKDIKDICIQVSKIFDLDICWIDVISPDFTKTLQSNGWIVLEVNATPGLWWDKKVLWINSAKLILERLFWE